MPYTQTIAYDDKTAGRKVMSFPPELPFAQHREELDRYAPEQHQIDILADIAAERSIFNRATMLAELIAGARAPHEDILRIARLTAAHHAVGLRLIQAALLALPPRQTMVAELAEFSSLNRLMQKITRKAKSGAVLKESEDWFKKKVMLLSMSLPLPNASETPTETPWIAWSEGVRLGLADPDPRWDKAILERAKVELEALDQRIKMLVASLDPDRIMNLSGYLFSLSEETRWRKQALDEDTDKFGEATLVIQKKVGERWKEIIAALEQSGAGALVSALFKAQTSKTHTYPHIKAGTAVLRGLLMHPLLARGHKVPDDLSCITLYVMHAGYGILELLFGTGAGNKDLASFLDLSGFDLSEKLLTLDLKKVPAALFVDDEGVPRDIDWFEVQKQKDLSYRSLVMSYMDNDNFLAELLNNPKAITKPGVVSVIAQRCRSSRILSTIANRRDLYTGFANKDVPLNLLLNPAKVSVQSIRKFIHVRYVDRMTLQKLSGRGNSVREEVRREIMRYLNTFH